MIVACPCCNYDQRLSLPGRAPDIQYDDTGMPTPKRNIRIYLPQSGEPSDTTTATTATDTTATTTSTSSVVAPSTPEGHEHDCV